MPFYIISTAQGYYNGIKDGLPTFSAELTSDVYVCGTSKEEAEEDFDFQRDLIVRAEGVDTKPQLISIKSKPAVRQSETLTIRSEVAAPPDGWRVLDHFGKYMALLYNGTHFAVRTKDSSRLYDNGKQAAIDWCMMRENVLKERIGKLAGGS